MGRNQSGFLQKQKDEKNALMHSTEILVKQFMLDTLQIALHRQKDAWGFLRIMRLMEDWEGVRKEYRPALDPKDPLADVAQAHMDREIESIIKNNMKLIPFRERYEELRPISYKGRKQR